MTDIKYYKVELINDQTGVAKIAFMTATDNPVKLVKSIDGMRIFWSVQLPYHDWAVQMGLAIGKCNG